MENVKRFLNYIIFIYLSLMIVSLGASCMSLGDSTDESIEWWLNPKSQLGPSKARSIITHRILPGFREDFFRANRKLLSDKKAAINSNNELFYFSNEELENFLKDFVDRCGHISQIYSIGNSGEGFPLWVLEISNSPEAEEPEPYFKYVGNMHGDEPLGRQLILYLADWLCKNYQVDPQATWLVDNVHLHLLPALNPDGFKHRKRNNAGDKDLNRAFPDQFYPQNNDETLLQPEVKAVLAWSRRFQFSASASTHEGALVANYPWDGNPERRRGYSKCPDDAAFRQLAESYSRSHGLMWNSSEFPHGITNGAQWYTLFGGMQDWNYISTGCMEITLELCNKKWPPKEELAYHWNLNRPAMLALVEKAAKSGIQGNVTSSANGSPVRNATIDVMGIDKKMTVRSKFGFFHRILAPGKYFVTVACEGYKSKSAMADVLPDVASRLDFNLEPLQHTVEQRENEKEKQGKSQESKSEEGDHVGVRSSVTKKGEGEENNDSRESNGSSREQEPGDLVHHDEKMSLARSFLNANLMFGKKDVSQKKVVSLKVRTSRTLPEGDISNGLRTISRLTTIVGITILAFVALFLFRRRRKRIVRINSKVEKL